MDYQSYIRSNEWREKRKLALRRDGYECQTCTSTERLEVHHKHYANFGNENLNDLITLCHDCHEAITNTIRERRYSKNDKPILEVQRITPVIEVNYGVQNADFTARISLTTTSSQRSDGRSFKSLLERDETSFQQAEQN